jgi:hypothetical protein
MLPRIILKCMLTYKMFVCLVYDSLHLYSHGRLFNRSYKLGFYF